MQGKCHVIMKIVLIFVQKLATSLPVAQWLEQLRFPEGMGSISVEKSYIFFSLAPLLLENWIKFSYF